jgi:hypothetical protein
VQKLFAHSRGGRSGGAEGGAFVSVDVFRGRSLLGCRERELRPVICDAAGRGAAPWQAAAEPAPELEAAADVGGGAASIEPGGAAASTVLTGTS